MALTDLFGNPIINSFSGDNRFLSNFYLAPIELWGITFPSTEHAFQWSKTNDPKEKEAVLWVTVEFQDKILRTPTTPGQAKREGNKVTMREDWPTVRIPIMTEVNRAKYSQHPELAAKLKATDEALLIEGNTWCDNTWGSCTCPKCVHKIKNNFLGKIEMMIRGEL